MWKNYNNEDVNRTLNPSSGTVKLFGKELQKSSLDAKRVCRLYDSKLLFV